jgi:ATP-dependent helicase HrpA
VRGLAYRLDHLAGGAARDRQRMAEVRPLEQRYDRLVGRLGSSGPDAEQSTEIADLGRQLEELRVSVFAQPVGARGPVSPKKVAAALDRLGA